MDPEKQPLTATSAEQQALPRRRSLTPRLAIALLAAAAVSCRLITGTSFAEQLQDRLGYTDANGAASCKQFDALVPTKDERLDHNRKVRAVTSSFAKSGRVLKRPCPTDHLLRRVPTEVSRDPLRTCPGPLRVV